VQSEGLYGPYQGQGLPIRPAGADGGMVQVVTGMLSDTASEIRHPLVYQLSVTVVDFKAGKR
jgi:hypothetical protein